MRTRPTAVRSTAATVFGVDVHANKPLSFLEGARATAQRRPVEVSVADAASPPAEAWPHGAELVCDQRERDGSISFQIEAHPQAGYRIWGPAHGTHLLSANGDRITVYPGKQSQGMGWQRLLIAQALPFAATLRGLEMFHAGAVLVEGAAMAFTGPSGAGKSTTVLELCDMGASFVADDVLALERNEDELIAHPGSPLLGIERQAARPRGAPFPPRAIAASDAGKLMVRMPCAERAAPLAALFFLDRRADGPQTPQFEQIQDPRLLLTATFNFVLSTPARLRGLLEVCSLVAARHVERIVFGPETSPTAVAEATRRRLAEGR